MRPILIAMEIIEAISVAQPIGVTELAQRMGLPRSTVQRALTTLHKAGWIEQADERRRDWRLSLLAMIISGRATLGSSGLRNIALPVMEEVRRQTEETVHLMVRHKNRVVLIERLDGLQRVDQFRPLGSDALMATTATGRSILARLPQADAADIIASNAAEGDLAPAVVEECVLRVNLAREAGFAITQGTNRANVGAVAAAILGSTEEPVAALSASGPLSRMDAARCERFGPTLADAARRISMGLRWNS